MKWLFDWAAKARAQTGQVVVSLAGIMTIGLSAIAARDENYLFGFGLSVIGIVMLINASDALVEKARADGLAEGMRMILNADDVTITHVYETKRAAE